MLFDDGWYIVRTRGDHHQLKHPTKKGLTTVQHPKKDLDPKVVHSILKQAGLQ
jgi:predicted RNA binding protein YcfA (HicA-like mRNA interferase family)